MNKKLPYVRSYEILSSYVNAKELANQIFLIKKFPKSETYSLTDQIRRSSRSIGAQIAERRQILGIDQKTAAELSGVSVHTFSDVESGKGNPSVKVLGKMLEALGMELRIQLKQMSRD